jgi:hypothetical protein
MLLNPNPTQVVQTPATFDEDIKYPPTFDHSDVQQVVRILFLRHLPASILRTMIALVHLAFPQFGYDTWPRRVTLSCVGHLMSFLLGTISDRYPSAD